MWNQIEGDIEGFFKGLWAFIVSFVKADVEPALLALVPIVEAAASSYITGNPAPAFNDFLHAVYTAVKPSLTGDLTTIEDSAITLVISGVAAKLGVNNVAGNNGLLPAGVQQGG
jgi:hypothetical protein